MTNQLRKRPPKPKEGDRPTPAAADTADANSDYKIGFCRPPKHSQFRPGQSGNKKGRPKGSRNIATIAKEVLFMPVTITEKGRKRVVPTLEAVLLRLRLDSLDGKPSAIDRLMKFLPTVQAAVEAEIQLQRDQKEHAREDEVDTIIRMARHIVTAGPDEEFEC